MRQALNDLASEHATWALPSSSFERLREAFGAVWEVSAVPPSPSRDKDRFNRSLDVASVYAGAEKVGVVGLGGIGKAVARRCAAARSECVECFAWWNSE